MMVKISQGHQETKDKLIIWSLNILQPKSENRKMK